MDARFRVKSPDDMIVTLALTMTIKEARELKAGLDTIPGGKTSTVYTAMHHLRNVIDQAEKVFFSEDKVGEERE